MECNETEDDLKEFEIEGYKRRDVEDNFLPKDNQD